MVLLQAEATGSSWVWKRMDWMSLNADICKKIQAVARASGAEEVIQLVESVIEPRRSAAPHSPPIPSAEQVDVPFLMI
jgi:hypothetical protein